MVMFARHERAGSFNISEIDDDRPRHSEDARHPERSEAESKDCVERKRALPTEWTSARCLS
jgi:hypothetical protein